MTRLRAPSTIRIGSGSSTALADVLHDCGITRALVVTDAGVCAAGITTQVTAPLRTEFQVFTAGPEPGIDEIRRCRDQFISGRFDGMVALGGGCVLDLAKAAAALSACGGRLADLYGIDKVRGPVPPIVALPTTPGSGGEVTAHAVVADADGKHAISGTGLVARAALIDPELTVTLPPQATLACGLDALLHGAEAYLSVAANAFSDSVALLGVQSIASALPRVRGGDSSAREDLAAGCLYANLAMANVNAGLVHALGYPLTVRFGIPHGLANALVAPAVLSASRAVQQDRDVTLARCLSGSGEFAEAMTALLGKIGLRTGLAHRGVPASMADQLADDALNYGPVRRNWRFAAERGDIARMYRDAM